MTLWIDILGTALLHSTWQFALIGLVLYLALELIPTRSSQTRYLAGCTAISSCFIAFVITLFWAASGPASPVADAYTLPRTGLDLASILVIVWLVGAALMATRNSISLLSISRLKSSARHDVPSESQIMFNRLANIMKVARARLVLSDDIKIPCTFGTLKPIVVLPASLLTRMSADEVEAILAHELAHIRRHDYLVNIVQQAILSILYYHPAVHYISREIDREREIACDNLASIATGHPQDLASALGKVTLFAHAPALTLSALGCDNDVANRMSRLVSPSESLRKSHRAAKAISTAIAAAGVLLCANLAIAYAAGPSAELTATESAQLRNEICTQVKKDGYYRKNEFKKSKMVRVDLEADTITLNGIAVTKEQMPNYYNIAKKYGLKRGTGQYIYFNSQGSGIEIGQDPIKKTVPTS